jgi:hypothetical protein
MPLHQKAERLKTVAGRYTSILRYPVDPRELTVKMPKGKEDPGRPKFESDVVVDCTYSTSGLRMHASRLASLASYHFDLEAALDTKRSEWHGVYIPSRGVHAAVDGQDALGIGIKIERV